MIYNEYMVHGNILEDMVQMSISIGKYIIMLSPSVGHGILNSSPCSAANFLYR
jgi:hypothetical protein